MHPDGESEVKPVEAAKPEVVRYVGTADERTLTVADFARHGVEVEAGVTWNRANGFKVPLAGLDFLDEEAFARFITNDRGFLVEH